MLCLSLYRTCAGYLLSTWVVDDVKKKNQLLSAGGSITTNHLFREDARSFGNPL